MTGAALVLGLHLFGVVDQIDAGWASVEWEGRAFGLVPVEALPKGVGEGDRIVMRVRRKRGSLVVLPPEIAPPDGALVRGTVQPPRAERARYRRSR